MTDERPARPRPKFVRKLEEQRERHHERSRLVRALYAGAGIVILLAGVVMLITPGPAFVLIPIGLAMLSLQFVWAEKLLDRSLLEAEKAREKAANTTTLQRVLTVVGGVLIAAAVLAVWAYYGDVPVVPWF